MLYIFANSNLTSKKIEKIPNHPNLHFLVNKCLNICVEKMKGIVFRGFLSATS